MSTDIAANLRRVLSSLRPETRLVAVSKYHPAEHIEAAYAEGQRIFGESHAQEMDRKRLSLPDDIEWHFIGHLQTNKVKYIAPYVAMIHAVDSIRLLREIEKQAAKHDRVIDVLLELHVAMEETKYGLTLDECRRLLDDGEWRGMSHVAIRGLMTMASNVDDESLIESEFKTAADFFDEIKKRHFADDERFSERSWGMSDDYEIAMRQRSTMVRVGTSIFGERTY